LALPTFALLFFCACAAVASELYVASWNVENLFDLEDDPNVERDEDFTPEGIKQWTAERLDRKLHNLSNVIMKTNGGRGPDVLGLCEVENLKVAEMLVDRLAPFGRKYEIVHQDSPSDRGIDCALVYDSGVFELSDASFHFVDAERTRDIVEARLRRNGEELYVFVNHWPSRQNDEWQRIKAATVLRQRLDAILAADPRADIVALGDFNDEPENTSIKDTLRAALNCRNLPPGAMYNTMAALDAKRKGTFVFHRSWKLIDQIIVSQGMLEDAGFCWRANSSERIDFPEVMFQPRGGRIARPFGSYLDDSYRDRGHSDHLPVGCIIVQ
jgi:predicted extracellular nuclease